MASIFGTSYPKFISDSGGANEVVVILPHSIIMSSKPILRTVENYSDYDGSSDAYIRGTHWQVEIRYLLGKEADPHTKYEVLKAFLWTQVSFFMHQDGTSFRKASSTTSDAMFMLVSVKPAYLKDADGYFDEVMLTFQSLTPVWMGKP